MKKLKLFFACLLMAVLSIGQVWGAIDANSTWTATAFGDLPDGATVIMINNFGNSFANATVTKAPAKVAASFNSTTKKITVSTEGKSLDDIAWTVEKATNGTKFWVCGSTTNILGLSKTNDNNAVSVNVTTTAKYNEFVLDGGLLKYYDASRYVGEYVSGSDWRSYTSATANNYKSGSTTQSLTFYVLDEGEETACATPTFSPAAGEVLSGTQVSISCSTEGAAIHYTTDGTNPTASSATYSAAIPVTSETTIKAIAVKAGLDNSSIASAAYTIATPLTTMQAIFEAATAAGSTATPTYITFSNTWVVTGVSTNGKNVYITDGTKGMILFNTAGNMGLVVGNTLSGTVQCNIKLYNGAAELDAFTTEGLTKGTADLPNVQALDAEGIAALTGVNTGSLIKISGECTYESSKYYIAGVQLYNQLYSFSVSAGTNYECTGVYVQYNTTKEICPRSAADIVAQTSVANPTFSPAAGEYTEVQNVTLSCATDGATVYYTTDGTNPTNESTVYSSAIEVGASMTIKAIAYKGEDHSEVVSAAYTINIPLPSHDFQVTHHFSTGEGFEFPTGWGGSYAEHEIAFTDDKVYFASASHQSGTITDRPVTKSSAIELILTNAHKLITAVRFDYAQWGTKTQTFVMKYSTDGGTTYSAFDPAVTGSDFAIQALDLPENVNAIQVTGTNSSNQVGLTSISFDLEDKPIVTKTVTITAPTNGTLVVKNGEDAISSGDDVEVGTILTIEATPAEGYKLTEVTVNGSAYTEATLELTENVTIAATFEENVADPVESFILSEIGVETSHLVAGQRVGDKVNLPPTAAECSKVFRGWDADPDCATAPTYAPGAEYTLALNNKLYAVYADPSASATWNVATSLEAGDVVVISTNTGYTANDMKTAGAISSSLFSCLASTYNADNSQITALAEGTLQFTVGGNATDGWTLMNGTKYLKVTAAKKVNLVDDEETWAISFSGNNATLVPATGDLTAYSIQYNYNTGNDRFTAYNTNQVPISLYKQVASYENYSTDCQAQVATPMFSPVAGTYTEAQNVTITCATAEATIYYTTNGDEPTTSSTEYTAAIPVNESMTIKAIAVKAGMANSAVASAAYTINLPLSTMDQIFAAATAAAGTATDVNIAFGNWVVSGVSTNGKNVFVTDGTKGFIIYDGGGEMGFAVGNILSGTVACKVQLFKGAAELTTLSSSTEGLSVSTGGVITPAAKAISALSGVNTGAAVTINSVQFDGTNLSDGANNIKPFNSLFAYDALENGKYYNVTGIFLQYDDTKEILPRSAADIQEVDLADPEISYTPAAATIELGEDLPGTVFANPHELAISYSSNNEAVATVSNAGVIALGSATGTAVITASFAGDATYAAANVTYTITVNPASVSENVVILAVYNEKYYAMSTNNASSAFTAIAVEYDGSQVTVKSAEDKAAIQWTRKTSGDNTTFQDANSKYMKSADGTSMSLQDAVCNWIWDENGFYKISGTTRTFFYQNGTGFKNFATSNFNKSGYSDKAQVIVIAPENIVITSKVSAELAYDPESDEITQGDAWSAPSLVNPHSVAITSYASDNESVATVDAGVIALAGGIGTAHITAHFDGDASYLAGSATYTITVNAPAPTPTGTTYTKVTSTGEITDGEYLIVYEEESVAFNGDLTTLDAANNTVSVVISGDEIAGTTAIDAAVFTIDVANGTLRAHMGDYIGVTSYGNGLKQNANAETYPAHSFSIDGDGNAVISLNNSWTAAMILNYNKGVSDKRFRYYKSASPQQSIQLYKKETPEPPTPTADYTRDVTVGNYGTICLPNGGNISGAKLFDLEYYDGASTLYLLEVNGNAMAAGRPYIFLPSATTIEVFYTDEENASAGESNGLVGSYSQAVVAIGTGDEANYILLNNEYHLVNSLAYVGANRAYIHMAGVPTEPAAPAPGAAPRRRVAMSVNGENAVQGIEDVQGDNVQSIKVLINGNLYILRGEKVYDATGRLVK